MSTLRHTLCIFKKLKADMIRFLNHVHNSPFVLTQLML